MVVLDNHLHFVPLFLNKRKQKTVDSVSDVTGSIQYVHFQSFSVLCWRIKSDTWTTRSTTTCWIVIQVDSNFRLFNLTNVELKSELVFHCQNSFICVILMDATLQTLEYMWCEWQSQGSTFSNLVHSKISTLKQYIQSFIYIQPGFLKYGILISCSLNAKVSLWLKAFVLFSYLTLDNAQWGNYKFNKNLRAVKLFSRCTSSYESSIRAKLLLKTKLLYHHYS